MNARRDVNARRGGAAPPRPSWLGGINAVRRRLEARPRSAHELYVLRADAPRRRPLIELALAAGVAVREVDAETLRRVTGAEQHQGVALRAEPYAYAELADVLARHPGPLLLLDQIQDPHNLGALIRSAAATGMAAVVIPRHEAAGVTPAVEKVSAGAVNDVAVCRIANLHRCLLGLREQGYWSIGLSPRAPQSLFTLDLPARPALVLGGETGLRALVQQTCDLLASIPLRGGVESLNASVAGALAMYEVLRRLPTP